MPNSPRGGGISRKITSATDRRRLQGDHGRTGHPRRNGPDRAHRRRQPAEARDQARLRIPAAAVGRHPRAHAEVGGAGADLRGSQPDQARDPRRLFARHRRDRGGWRARLAGGARVHAHADAEPRQEGAALEERRDAVIRQAPGGCAARRDADADGAASFRRLSGHQPDRGAGGDRRQLRPLDARARHRGDGAANKPGGCGRTGAAVAAARPSRADRHRLHRHGDAQAQRDGREAA